MSRLRVLIAEDEPVSATILVQLIEQEGHHVLDVLADGNDVLQSLATLKPDVVLMDVHLADNTSGLNVTRTLLERRSVPVIVISATESRDELQEIAESGALGFIKKPVSPEGLHVALGIAIRHTEAMRRLSDSELLHRGIFDNAAVGIYVCHVNGDVQMSNQAYAKMLGYSGPAELLHSLSAVGEQLYVESGRHAHIVSLLEKASSSVHMESQVYGRDGDVLWISEYLTPSFGEDGCFEMYQGVVINVTATKQAEEERNLAYSLVQNTMDAIGDAVVVTDLEGNIIISNKAFTEDIAPCLEDAQRLSLFPAQGHRDILARFLDDIREHPHGSDRIRGVLGITGSQVLYDTSISRYTTPEMNVIGAVFVLRPHDTTAIAP